MIAPRIGPASGSACVRRTTSRVIAPPLQFFESSSASSAIAPSSASPWKHRAAGRPSAPTNEASTVAPRASGAAAHVVGPGLKREGSTFGVGFGPSPSSVDARAVRTSSVDGSPVSAGSPRARAPRAAAPNTAVMTSSERTIGPASRGSTRVRLRNVPRVLAKPQLAMGMVNAPTMHHAAPDAAASAFPMPP